MATFQNVDVVEVMGRPARHPRWSWIRIAAVSLAAAVATVSVSLAIGKSAGAALNALNPQPLPPSGEAVLALNPQPIPPGVRGGAETWLDAS